jgi:hypothetical protein
MLSPIRTVLLESNVNVVILRNIPEESGQARSELIGNPFILTLVKPGRLDSEGGPGGIIESKKTTLSFFLRMKCSNNNERVFCYKMELSGGAQV